MGGITARTTLFIKDRRDVVSMCGTVQCEREDRDKFRFGADTRVAVPSLFHFSAIRFDFEPPEFRA